MLQRDSHAGLQQELASAFDGGPIGRRTGTDAVSVDDSLVSIIGNAPFGWFRDSLTEAHFGQGFADRFLYVLPTPRQPEPELWSLPEPDQAAEDRLESYAAELFTLTSGMTKPCVWRMTKEVGEHFEAWRIEHHARLARSANPELFGAIFGRMESYVWKIAILFAIASEYPDMPDPNAFTIDREHVRTACKLVSFIRDLFLEHADRLIGTADPRDLTAKRRASLRGFLGRNPGAGATALYQGLKWADARTLPPILDVEIEAGEVKAGLPDWRGAGGHGIRRGVRFWPTR